VPLIRIDLNDHFSATARRAIADAVHRSVVDVLEIPEGDRFQIISVHATGDVIALDAGLNFDRSTDVVVIQIFTQRGRSTDAKQRLFAEVARQLARLGVHGEDVVIALIENGPDDWSFGFGSAQYVTGELPVPNAQEFTT
jgi:phenylpyruvate tautomerase PptA (4-oxalocrotonate tautomerase family)